MKRDTRIAAAVFAAIPVGIVAAAAGCTALVAGGGPAVLRLPFRLLCHGIASRCLTLWGEPMPICARCTGIYAGLFVGISLFAIAWRRIDVRVARWLATIMAVPIAVDGIAQALRLRESTNPLRLITGFAVALTFGIWVLASIEKGRQVEGRIAVGRSSV